MEKNTFILFLLFVLGCLAFFGGFTRLRRKRLIENIPTSTVRGMALGLVELVGIAKKKIDLVSPLTGQSCVYYKYLIERYVRQQKNSHWVSISQGESMNAPFFLEDETGTVLVIPYGAEKILVRDYEFTTGFSKGVPENCAVFMDTNGIDYRGLFGTHKLRFSEWLILPGDTVYVLGTAKKVQDRDVLEATLTLTPASPENADIYIGKGKENNVFILSDETQKKLISTLFWQSLIGICVGALFALVSLFLFLSESGWLRF